MKLIKVLLCAFLYSSLGFYAKAQCNLQLIRQTFTNAGCVELTTCQDACSLYFILPQQMSGSAAQAFAQNLGTNLTSIESAAENTCILNNLNTLGYGGVIWIGFNDITNEGSFTWFDQANVGYTNWASGEPNQSGNEDCVQIYADGSWNDLDCNSNNSKSVIEVNLCPQTTITPNPASASVCIGNSVTLTAATILGSPPYNYTWSPATGLNTTSGSTVIASPTTTTTYTVTMTDRYGCTSIQSLTVAINQPFPNAGSDNSICAGASYNINASGGVSYSWSPATGLSSTSIPNPAASPANTTTYTLTATDAFGCTATDDITITVNPLPLADAGTDAAICQNALAFLNGSGGGTYVWSPGTGLSNPGIASPTASPSSTTTYTLTVTDANGCVNTDQLVLTVNPLPNANAGSDQSICNGANANLQASGGVSYSWSPGATLSANNISNPVASPLVTTLYTVIVTDGNNCSATDDITITVNTLPSANAGLDQSICLGGSTGLSATGGLSFSWSPTTGLDNALISTPNASPNATTTYTVTVTDGNNCSNTDDVIITVNPLPNANAGADATACLNSIFVMGASGGSSYVWSPVTGLSDPNSAAPVATPPGTTTYTVSVTDANGCVNTDQMTLTINPLPTPNAGSDQAICLGQSANLSASGGLTYAWLPAATLDNPSIANPVATPGTTTTYTVTVTDANNCLGSDDILITVNPLPPADAGPDEAICLGSSVNLGAGGGISYSWNPTTNLDDPSISNPNANPTTNTTYTVTVTDANGCVNTDDVDITINPLPTANAGNDASICFGNTITLNASGGILYQWSPAIALSNANISNPVASPAGSVTYTVNVTDNNGCQNTDMVIITVTPPPAANAGIDLEICSGETIGIQGSGNGNTFSWSPATGLDDPNSPSPQANPTSTTNYVLTVTDINNCTSTDQMVLQVNPVPFVNFSVSEPCLNFPSAFTNLSTVATGAIINYNWDFGDGSLSSDNSPVYTYQAPGSYTVNLEATTDQGCQHDTTLTAIVNPLPEVSFTAEPITTGCIPLDVNFTSTSTILTGSIASLQWNLGNGALPSGDVVSTTYNLAENFTVSLTATSDKNCSASLVLPNTVQTSPKPSAFFTAQPNPADILMDPIVLFQDSSQGDSLTWQWNFGDGGGDTIQNPFHAYSDTGFFNVYLTVTNSFGCSDQIMRQVYVSPAFTLYIPNAFTVNQDRVNETFKPKGIGIASYEMVIMNRWGGIVFRTRNIEEGWDGTLRDTGSDLKQDMYTYQISIRDMRDYPHLFRGTVMLFR
ncbi:MAG: PKD domain-containing protein [Bacteroidia bacterium]|nr:PKD domain-containing protein [Bacteroidia bacterium]